MPIGTRGLRRDFDLNAATHIAVMAELVRVGLGAGTASAIAGDRGQNKQLCLVFGMQPAVGTVVHDPSALASIQEHLRRAPAPIGFDREEQLPGVFKRYGISPSVYTVINVEQIAARMQQASDEWERRSEGKKES